MRSISSLLLVALVVLLAANCVDSQPKTITPLTQYVYNPDLRWYHWNVSATPLKGPGYTAYNVFMQSQKWLTAAESDSSIWSHWLQICVPDNLLADAEHAFLYIDGGSTPRNFNNPPDSIEFVITKMCRGAKTLGAVLHQIPNQPVYFTGDPTRGRSEDAFIAYTWSHFVNNSLEPDWLARMPMTKASIKAIDTIQAFAQTLSGVKVPTKFVIAGASKRGWTTWMVGAMGDPRVVGLVPIVAPIANLIPQINEMWESYGNWSFALKDYTDMNLMGFLNLPVFTKLLHIIDPLTYLPEMAIIPKYVIVAAGDEFFMPDSAQYYWNQLTGEKHLRIVPNAEHSLAGHIVSVLDGALEFYKSLMNEETTRPTYSWTISADGGTITLTTSTTQGLVSAKAWMSNNTHARDWRLITCAEKSPKCANPAFFKSVKLTQSAPGVFSYTHAMPTVGWSAFFIELEYDINKDGDYMTVTSDMSIIPKKMPYAHCGIDVCYCGYQCPGLKSFDRQSMRLNDQ